MKRSEVKVAQPCPTLCDPMDYTGLLQARILEWVAFPFSRGSSQPRFPRLQADSSPAKPPGKTNQANSTLCFCPKVCSLSAYILIRNTGQTLATTMSGLCCIRISGRQGLHTPEASVSCLSFRARSLRWNRAPSQKLERSNKALNSSVSQILVDILIDDEASLHVG